MDICINIHMISLYLHLMCVFIVHIHTHEVTCIKTYVPENVGTSCTKPPFVTANEIKKWSFNVNREKIYEMYKASVTPLILQGW